VKLNVLDLTPVQLVHEVERCRAFDLKLVAERVETQDKMSFCRQLGFDLFQGYLLSRAEVVKGQSLNPRRATCLRLIEELCNPETSAGEIQRIVETDGALSYRFLRLAGEGAAGGLRRRLSSVREGVVMLGHRRLRAWVMIMLLSDVHAGSTEQLNIAMARARMCELIALSVEPRLADSAFTVGLVSALDLLLGAPLPRILKDLSLTEELVNALLDHDGRLGRMLADVLAWETGGGELRPQCGLTLDGLEKCYLEALAWSTSVCGELEPVA
jgi:EAL and modified HD-GYP domain-containing signal transduction protein